MNEFKVKKGLIVQGSGSTILDIQGSQGQLFSVTDSLSGSLFSVNDISGVPIMEVFSDNRVNLGTFNAEAIKVSGSFATMTGSLFGTASWANNATSASFATTASFTTAVTGTTNYVSKFTGTNTLGNSQIFDNGTNVGIGTTSPSNGFHISGTTKSVLVENQGGVTTGMTLKSTRSGWFQSINIFGGTSIANGQQMQFGQYDNGKMFFFNSGNFPIGFYTNGTEKLSITATGNVGIGTTTPSARLVSLDTSNNISALFGGGATAPNWIAIGTVNSGTVPFIQGYNNTVTGTSNLCLNPLGSANVGIGNTSPTQKLDVTGNIKISNNNSLMFRNAANNADIAILQLTNTNQLNIGTTSSSVPSVIALHTNSTERMRITSTGNVGIGTTTPQSILDVNGDALINGLTVGRGGGNLSSNTVVGINALSSNSSGQNIIAVGRDAVKNLDEVDGLTVIGVDANRKPDLTDLESNSIVINQFNPDFGYGQQVPHFYAPDKIYCPINFVTNLLTIDYSVYTAAFLEYSIYNSGGDQFRAGRFVAAFKGTGTPEYQDYQEVVYSGTTLAATFSITWGGTNAIVQLENYDSDDYTVRFTSRLLMR